MQEIWKDVEGYEGLYQVSNLGNVKSIPRVIKSSLKHQNKVLRKGRLLKQSLNHNGYPQIVLKILGKCYCKRVHRLVAEVFIPNPNNYPQINHIDGNKLNNKVSNLEWCTAKQNIIHAFKEGLYKTPKKAFKKGQNSVKVNQYTVNGNFIRTYNSITEASEQFLRVSKRPHSSISSVVRGKSKTAFGYIWRYAD